MNEKQAVSDANGRRVRRPMFCRVALLSCLVVGWVCAASLAADWPMWRCDAGRTAASPAELPDQLHLLWKRELPAPRPAFPHDNRLRFDLSYEPVVLGKTMFVPSMVTDTVTALDTETGEVKWAFFADGPVRLAPVAWQGKVYFVSDDGYLYCLDAATGALRWKYTPVPERLRGQKVLGHERLVSRWPARGGPVLADGVVYFAAGVFPFEGAWVCAVDAQSGKAIWVNGDGGLIRQANQDHGGAWDTGLSPQGYLAIAREALAVPSGRALPAFFDRRTGQRQPYSAGWGGRTGLAKGSWYVASIGQYLFQSGDLYGPKPDVPDVRLPAGDYITLAELARQTGSSLDAVQRWMHDLGMAVVQRDGQPCVRLRNWGTSHLYWTGSGPRRDRERQVQRRWPRLQIDPTNDRRSLGPFRQPVLTPEAVYYSRSRDAWLKKKDKPVRELVAYDLRQPLRWQFMFIQGMDGPPRDLVPWKTVAFKQLWSLPCELNVQIKAGSRLYCAGKGCVAAVEIPRGGRQARISWQAAIDGTPTRLLAADQKLFVVTGEGGICAFGAGSQPVRVHRIGREQEPAAGASQEKEAAGGRAATILKQTGVSEGYCLVLGVGTGRLVEELARRSKLHIVVLEPDPARAERARRRFLAAGPYGTRIHVLAAELAALQLPPYFASLAICNDAKHIEQGGSAERPDQALLDRLFRSLRPYGGVACLRLEQRAAVSQWLREAKPAGAELAETEQLLMLKRLGPLPGADDWTHEAGGPGNTFASADRLVKPPLAVLWFGGAFDRLGPGCRGVPRLCAGRMFIHFGGDLLAIDIYTGRLLWRAAGIASPQFVAVEDGLYVQSGGTCVRLAPATGSKLGQLDVPGASDRASETKRAWSVFRIWGKYFVGTTGKPFRFPSPFEFDFAAPAGKELICLDRHSGKKLWSFRPKRDGISFALGAGKAFCVDYWLPAHRRRGEPDSERATVSAIDLASGKVLWQADVTIPAASKRDSPFGQYQPMTPWLSYCHASDVLVLTANWSSLGAWRGQDGQRLWSKPVPCADPPSRYSVPQPPILLPELLITHGGQMYEPRTGKLLPDRLWRGINAGTRGCNRALACPHVAVLRDADISYFDLSACGRETRLRGIRSGCTNGLLPAGGVLNAPNLAYHCSCNYPIFTSMALAHMPFAAEWLPAPETRR